MSSSPKKRRWFKRTLIILIGLPILFFASFYFVLSSPKFLNYVIRQVNVAIPGELSYDKLEFSLEKRSINATNFSYLNPQGKVAVSLDTLQLKFTLLNALRGRLHIRDLRMGNLLLDFNNFPKRGKTPLQWRTVLNIIFKRLIIEQSQIASLTFSLPKQRKIILNNLSFSLTKHLLGNHQLNLQLENAVASFNNTPLKIANLNFSGSLDLPILRDYAFYVAQANGNLTLKNIEYPGIPSGSLKADFTIDGDTVAIKQGQLETLHGILDIDLSYHRDKPGLELKLANEKAFSFDAIPKASARLKKTFSGFKIDLNTDLTGKGLKELNGNIDLEIDILGNRSHDNTPDHKVALKGKFKNGQLNFDLFQIRSDKMTLHATGGIDFAKQSFDTKIDTQDFDITTLVNTLAEIDISGYADAQGTVRGTFTNPEIIMQVKSRETGYSFMEYGPVQGEFKIQNKTLSFVGKTPPGEGYEAQVDVQTTDIFKKTRHTKLLSKFKDISVTTLLQNPEMKGKVSGSFDMEATSAGQKTGTLQAKITDFVLHDFHFDEIETTGKLLNSTFTLNPSYFQPFEYEKLQMPTPIVFNFNDKGWTIDGKILPSITVAGKFSESQPNRVLLNTTFDNTNLKPILAAMKLPILEVIGSGEVKMTIGVDDAPTNINIKLSLLKLPLDEGFIQNEGPLEIDISPPKVSFKQARFLSGNESFILKGSYTLDGPIDLSLNGKLNLGILEFLPQYFRDTEGFANLDLKIGGVYEQPTARGEISFENASITLRPIRGQIEELNGSIKISPNLATFDNLRGTMREGDLTINGPITLNKGRPTFYDLNIGTREVAISEPGVYKVIFSGDFAFKGPAGKAKLSGTMDINDGIYSRDFSITESFLRPKIRSLEEAPSPFLENILLDLQVRSPGELSIKNNIARIFFNADLQLKGPATNPKVSGALEVLNGELHYFTVDFEDARGTIDFRDSKKGPYVDIALEKNYESTFDDITVVANVRGFTDDLQMTFTSNPPLERKDILALVFSGSLPGDARRNLSGANLASTVLATQLSQVIQKPLAKTARLDIFRLEASDPTSRSFSSLVVGKKLTDRFSLEFKTDLGVDEPVQGLQMEYLLLDNILIKGTQLSDGEFDFNLALRFRLF